MEWATGGLKRNTASLMPWQRACRISCHTKERVTMRISAHRRDEFARSSMICDISRVRNCYQGQVPASHRVQYSDICRIITARSAGSDSRILQWRAGPPIRRVGCMGNEGKRDSRICSFISPITTTPDRTRYWSPMVSDVTILSGTAQKIRRCNLWHLAQSSSETIVREVIVRGRSLCIGLYT